MRSIAMLALITSIVLTGCATSPLAAAQSVTETGTPSSLPTATPVFVSPTLSSTVTHSSPNSPTSTESPSAQTTMVTPRANVNQTTPTPSIPSSQATNTSSAAFSGATKLYTNPKIGIALDYPSDWSVSETANGANFTSPQRAVVQLEQLATGGTPPSDFSDELRLPNTRCLTTANPHGLTIKSCLDTIGFVYTANFSLQAANGEQTYVVLLTRSNANAAVFKAMVASLRRVP